MKNLLTISLQTFWQLLGKSISSISTLIILGLVTRNYGEGGAGIFTLTVTYLSIFYLLSDFGFNAHVLRNIKSNNLPMAEQMSNLKSEWQRLLGTRILWSVLLIIVAVGSLPLLSFISQDFSRAVVFGSLAIIGSGVFVTCNLVFQSKFRYDLSVVAASVGTLLSMLTFIYLVTLKLPIPFLLIAHVIGWLIMAILAVVLIRRFLPITPILDTHYALSLFKESWPIAATLTLNVVYFRADSFIITYFKGLSEAGVYNVAYSIFQTILVLPTFMMNAYYPVMLRSLNKVRLIGLSLVGLALVGTITTLFLAPVVVKLITGEGFGGASQSLQILSLGLPAFFLSALMMWLLLAKGQYMRMLMIYAAGLIFNLLLNFSFIPQYSFYGASWITVISEYLILIMQAMVLLLG